MKKYCNKCTQHNHIVKCSESQVRDRVDFIEEKENLENMFFTSHAIIKENDDI